MLKVNRSNLVGPNQLPYEVYQLFFQDPSELLDFDMFNTPVQISLDLGEFVWSGYSVKYSLLSYGDEILPLLTWTFGDGVVFKGDGYLVGEHDDAIVFFTENEISAANLKQRLPAEFHAWIESLMTPKH